MPGKMGEGWGTEAGWSGPLQRLFPPTRDQKSPDLRPPTPTAYALTKPRFVFRTHVRPAINTSTICQSMWGPLPSSDVGWMKGEQGSLGWVTGRGSRESMETGKQPVWTFTHGLPKAGLETHRFQSHAVCHILTSRLEIGGLWPPRKRNLRILFSDTNSGVRETWIKISAPPVLTVWSVMMWASLSGFLINVSQTSNPERQIS